MWKALGNRVFAGKSGHIGKYAPAVRAVRRGITEPMRRKGIVFAKTLAILISSQAAPVGSPVSRWRV